MADLPALAAFVDTACDDFGADDEVRFAVRLSVEEVFTNIIEIAYRGKGPVLIEVDGGPHYVRVRLSDEAPTLDRAGAGAPALGVAQRLMDEVGHGPAQSRGNTYVLVKQLPAYSPVA